MFIFHLCYHRGLGGPHRQLSIFFIIGVYLCAIFLIVFMTIQELFKSFSRKEFNEVSQKRGQGEWYNPINFPLRGTVYVQNTSTKLIDCICTRELLVQDLSHLECLILL